MKTTTTDIQGLNDNEVEAARKKYGRNLRTYKKENGFLDALKSIITEPMVILLLIASSVYFFTGNISDGIFMIAAILLVAAISLFQDSRSRNALVKLKAFTQPTCKVIRNRKTIEIRNDEIVIGDFMIAEEGSLIAADGIIIQSNDFSVNESILTGESLAVFKDNRQTEPFIFSGTTVTSGLAIAVVTAIGNDTQLGKIGKSLENIETEKTPLEQQISDFVRKMVVAGAVIFLIVWSINYLNTHLLLESLIRSLTLAMSILPEEIPVAFTTFMALGAWRMMQMGIVVKQMKTVEALGSATIICTDKTGTLTENRMSLARLYTPSHLIAKLNEDLCNDEAELLTLAMWASEPIPFEPMELALHNAYKQYIKIDERKYYKLIHEYPLSGKPPMMTHLYENANGKRIIAAKGAPEALLQISKLSDTDRQHIEKAMLELMKEGFRVLGVATTQHESNDFPKDQQHFSFTFKGLVAFYDPPKPNIQQVLQNFYTAGIDVKIITGDNPETTAAIARQIGFHGSEHCFTGNELMQFPEETLASKVKTGHLFTRMFPEAKLRIINALKAQHEIVAMTGDGVNDGPALKAAHIGIAMGKNGTEIAKQAASLILLEDDLAHMVDAIAMGRRIYTNLKKAIQYIISIHIPIILTVFIPLALGWKFPNIFSPIHIIFLELIMGPTCSIIYENEPIEPNIMLQPPRPFTSTFFNWNELAISVLQGLAITAGTISAYQYALVKEWDEYTTRTILFTVLISANIFLTLVNRSFYYSLFTTLRYKNWFVPVIISITLVLMALLLYVPALSRFFGFTHLNYRQLVTAIGIGAISVLWYEVVKGWKRWKTI